MKLLVVGARPGSLGAAIAEASSEWPQITQVRTAGISGEEMKLDITNSSHISGVLEEVRPNAIVCTVGVNEQVSVTDTFLPSRMTDAFRTNVIGPIHLLSEFAQRGEAHEVRPRFVAISSNSARIARTNSVAYCASKAALSMALRVAGREFARNNAGVLVWGYEPGLLDTVMTREMFPHDPGTPATLENPHRWPVEGPMHRMEGIDWRGLNPYTLADRILGDLLLGNADGLNGCMIPFDAGEQ